MAAKAHFEIQQGAEAQRFDMPDGPEEVLVGRSGDCQWVIASGAISRRHARIRRMANEIHIEDLDSSNGTFVNGERLSGPRMLADQDQVKFGSVEIRFVMSAERESDATISVNDLPSPVTIVVPPSAQPPRAPRPAAKASSPPPAAASEETDTAPLEPKFGTMAAPPPPPQPTPPPRQGTLEPPPPIPPPPRPQAAPQPQAPPQPAPSPVADSSFSRPAADAMHSGDGPSYVELAAIAGGSFLIVCGVGALLLRYVF